MNHLPYFDKFPDLAVSKTYSLTMIHIARVADLAERLKISQGEVVRNAIDLLYEKLEDESEQQNQQS